MSGRYATAACNAFPGVLAASERRHKRHAAALPCTPHPHQRSSAVDLCRRAKRVFFPHRQPPTTYSNGSLALRQSCCRRYRRASARGRTFRFFRSIFRVRRSAALVPCSFFARRPVLDGGNKFHLGHRRRIRFSRTPLPAVPRSVFVFLLEPRTRERKHRTRLQWVGNCRWIVSREADFQVSTIFFFYGICWRRSRAINIDTLTLTCGRTLVSSDEKRK